MTLEVEIYGHNVEITERINGYVTKKVSRLDRYLPGIEEARVDLAFVKICAQLGRPASRPDNDPRERIYPTLGRACG